MSSDGQDAFQPQWAEGCGVLPLSPPLAAVQESIAAAVVEVQRIAGQAFGEANDELSAAGARLAGGLSHLKEALEYFTAHYQPPHTMAEEHGLDESKLFANIERWQRRYQELEAEYAVMETRLQAAEREVKTLKQENTRLEKIKGQIMVRLERSIDTIDTILDMGGGDEEHRDYH